MSTLITAYLSAYYGRPVDTITVKDVTDNVTQNGCYTVTFSLYGEYGERITEDIPVLDLLEFVYSKLSNT